MKARISSIAVFGFLVLARTTFAVDQNGNDMSDVWENLYSIPANEASRDYDGDGFTNRQESVLGTDPRNRLSRANLEMIWDTANAELRLRINTSLAKIYQVETSNELTAWTAVGPPVNGTGNAVDVITTLPNSSVPAGFFRYNCNELDTDGDELTAWRKLNWARATRIRRAIMMECQTAGRSRTD